MSIQEFFDKWNNKGIDFDGYYGFQCMDLAHKFAVDVNGIDIPSAPSAKDVWGKTAPGYDKIKNTPDGVPERGDIIIWGTVVGQYGHIAVYDHGDSTSFTSFDQNWPVNSLCHYQSHNYKGVLGWLRPKNRVGIAQEIAQSPTITDSTKIPGLDNKEVQQIRSELEAKNRKIADDAVTISRAIKDAQEAIRDAKEIKSKYDSLDAAFAEHMKTHSSSPKTDPKTETKPTSAVTVEPPVFLVDLLHGFLDLLRGRSNK